MKSLPWITLLAYRARVEFEEERTDGLRNGARREATRGRKMDELRLAVASALEQRVLDDPSPVSPRCTCTNDDTAAGFVVRVLDGESISGELSFASIDDHAVCRYAFGGNLARRDGEADVQIDLDAAMAIPTVLDNQGALLRFDSMSHLAEHLLNPLLRA